MGDGIDTRIEVHRRDPDPHPRLKAEIDARLDEIEADVEALSGGPGVPPGLLDPSDAVPLPVEDGVVAGPGTSDDYSRGDHQHELKLPQNLADIAGMSGSGVLVRNDAGVIAPTQSPTVTGRVTAGALKVTGQAGTGERVVLADDTGNNRAETKAQWETRQFTAITALGQWLTGADSDASGVTDGTGDVLNAIGFYAGYVVHTRAASPAGPLGAGYQSGRASGSAGVAPYPGYTRASCTADAGTQLTVAAFVYRPAGRAVPTFYLADDAVSAANLVGINGYQASGIDKSRLLIGATFSGVEVTFPEDTWIHVALTIDSDTGTTNLYFDGVLVDTLVEPVTLPANPNLILQTGDSAVGGPSYGAPFMAGFVQGMTIIDGLASAATIALMAAGEVYTAALIEDGGEASGVTQLHLTDDAGLQIDAHAGTGQRMVTSDPDGVHEPVANPSPSPAGSYGAVDRTLGVVLDIWGRVTSISDTLIQIAQSQVTGLVTALSDIWTAIGGLVRRDRMPFNVKDYGATGDGVADDLAGIVAAIAAAPAGGAVYFPPGNYRCSAYFAVAKSLVLFGAHQKQSIITFDAAAPFALGANIYVSAYPFAMADLTVDGSYPTAGQHLVRVGPCTSFTVDRCRFTRMKTRAAMRANWESTGGGSTYGNLKVRNCRFDTGDAAGAVAFYTDSTGKGIDGVEVSNCEMVDVGGPCCAIEDTSPSVVGNEKWGGFVNTKFYGNYILANDTGPYGAIPAELWGHDYMNVYGNTVEAGTRGIGMSACRYSSWNNNTIKNQTLYACEIAAGVGLVFQGNTIVDCRSFVEDTSLAPDSASSDVTIASNSISGSGLAAPDGTARCIKANALAVGRGWKVVNNSFKDYINGSKVISLAGAAGSGGHTVKGNTYDATEADATFAFYSSDTDDDVCADNTIRISADYTASNPNFASGNVVMGSAVAVSDIVISGNSIAFTGADASSKLSAYGSLSAASTGERHAYFGNTCSGAFVYRMAFPTDDAASICDNNLDGGTGTVSIPATVIRAQRKARYQAAAVPASGTWERGDIIDNSAPAINAILRWVCITSGTPGAWQADYLQGWDGAAGTNRDCNFYTAGVKRAGMRVNSTAESGGDAGSNVSFYVVADNGTTERQWLFVRRTATGEATFTVNRMGIYPRSATTVDFWVDAWDGTQAGRITWREGNTLRWIMQKAGTSADWTMAAYTSGGVLIDTPVTIVNAANGLMTLARPLKLVHATAAAAPGANEVTVGGGTIKMARTADATAREAVAGDDTRLSDARKPAYVTGAGGAVTQLTGRTTGVTLNKLCGAITLVSAAGSATWQTFTVTNSTVAATDVVTVNQKSGTDLYMIHVTAVADGSFNITFATTGGTTTEQPVFNFAVVKAVAA